jgi:uncharacterized protein YndB with AHSA1/START domain
VIEKRLYLPCPPPRAFALLTEQAGAWWPPDRRHTKDPASEIRMEASGRFFERATDGTEVELGVVRIYDPPNRLVLDWYPGTGPDMPTQVEIVLTAEGEGTRVALTHGPGPLSAEMYPKRAAAYDRSWELVFAAWAIAASAG